MPVMNDTHINAHRSTTHTRDHTPRHAYIPSPHPDMHIQARACTNTLVSIAGYKYTFISHTHTHTTLSQIKINTTPPHTPHRR